MDTKSTKDSLELFFDEKEFIEFWKIFEFLEDKIKIEEERYLGSIVEAHIVDYFSKYLINNNFFSFRELNIDYKKLLKDRYIESDKQKNTKSMFIDLYFENQINSESAVVEFKNKNLGGGGYYISDIIRVNDIAKLFNLKYGIFICTNIKSFSDKSNMKNGVNIIEKEIFQNANGDLLEIKNHKRKVIEIFDNEIKGTNCFATIIIFYNKNFEITENINEKYNPDNVIEKLIKTEEIENMTKKLENEIENEIENDPSIISINRGNIEKYIEVMGKIKWINEWNSILGLNVFPSVIKKIKAVEKDKIDLFLNNILKDFDFDQEFFKSKDPFSHLNNIWKKNSKEKEGARLIVEDKNKSVNVIFLNKRSDILKSLFLKWITIEYKSDKIIDESFLKIIERNIDDDAINNIWYKDEEKIIKASKSAFKAIIWLIKLNEEFKIINCFLLPQYKKIKKGNNIDFINCLKLFLSINKSNEINLYEICDKILIWDKNYLKNEKHISKK